MIASRSVPTCVAALVAALFFMLSPAQAQAPFYITTCGTVPSSLTTPIAGAAGLLFVDTTGKLCVNATVTASVTGFAPGAQGTPISVTTSGVTGTLPAGAVVVATNVGANGAYCALGASATTGAQYIAPSGGWFAFTVGASTQLTCITSTSTTTVNMIGGSGLPTGVGGAGSAGGGGAVTIASGGVASGAYAAGSIASGAAVDGWDVTEGTKADTAYTSGSGSVVSILKGIYGAATGPIPAGTNGIGTINSQYPTGATPITISATGTTAATTATLAASASVTTYICWFSIRANATAAATGNATVTGTITGTLNFTQWTAPLASGLGVVEEIFNPCVPASAVNTTIAVVSAAPGSGGVVSVSAGGYQK
jgi:hypothetical protein